MFDLWTQKEWRDAGLGILVGSILALIIIILAVNSDGPDIEKPHYQLDKSSNH